MSPFLPDQAADGEEGVGYRKVGFTPKNIAQLAILLWSVNEI